MRDEIMLRWAMAMLASALLPSSALASECDDPDPNWLLCEDFENGGLGWESWFAQSRWTECDGCPGGSNDPDRITLVQDAGLAHDGQWTLHMPGGAGAGYMGGTLRFPTCEGEQQAGCPLVGYDELYLRAWVRLDAEHDYVHHFLGISGSRPDAYWEAYGNAGCRPNGERWAGTRVDMTPEHEFFFYTYFPEMQCDAGGYCSGSYAQNICDGCAADGMPCTNGLECCWGKHFQPEPPVAMPTETWTCIEMMARINTPGQADGVMAFWVNDQPAHEQTGMHWRDVSELQFNRVNLEHFIDDGDTDHENPIWFDDVVVSPQRIGCSPDGSAEDGASSEGSGADGDASSGGGSGEGGEQGSGATTSNGGESTNTATATSDGEGSGTATATSDGEASDTTTPSSGSVGEPTGVSTTAGSDGSSEGCGCRATSTDPFGFGALGIVVLVGRRRGRTTGHASATLRYSQPMGSVEITRSSNHSQAWPADGAGEPPENPN